MGHWGENMRYRRYSHPEHPAHPELILPITILGQFSKPFSSPRRIRASIKFSLPTRDRRSQVFTVSSRMRFPMSYSLFFHPLSKDICFSSLPSYWQKYAPRQVRRLDFFWKPLSFSTFSFRHDEEGHGWPRHFTDHDVLSSPNTYESITSGPSLGRLKTQLRSSAAVKQSIVDLLRENRSRMFLLSILSKSLGCSRAATLIL